MTRKTAGRASDHGLAEALLDLARHVLHLFADAGRSYRLSQQQVELICAVIVRGKIGMGELGKLLHLEKSNLSNLVDRLEQRGLVVRTRDPHDRRATRVALTDDGTAVAMRTYGEVTARLRALLTPLPAREQRQLAAVARRLVEGEHA